MRQSVKQLALLAVALFASVALARGDLSRDEIRLQELPVEAHQTLQHFPCSNKLMYNIYSLSILVE